MKKENAKIIVEPRDYSLSLHAHLEIKVDDLLENLAALEDRLPDSELLVSLNEWVKDIENLTDEVQEILDRAVGDDEYTMISAEDIDLIIEIAQQLPEHLNEGVDIIVEAWTEEEISEKFEDLLREWLMKDIQPTIDSGWRLYHAMIMAD